MTITTRFVNFVSSIQLFNPIKNKKMLNVTEEVIRKINIEPTGKNILYVGNDFKVFESYCVLNKCKTLTDGTKYQSLNIKNLHQLEDEKIEVKYDLIIVTQCDNWTDKLIKLHHFANQGCEFVVLYDRINSNSGTRNIYKVTKGNSNLKEIWIDNEPIKVLSTVKPFTCSLKESKYRMIEHSTIKDSDLKGITTTKKIKELIVSFNQAMFAFDSFVANESHFLDKVSSYGVNISNKICINGIEVYGRDRDTFARELSLASWKIFYNSLDIDTLLIGGAVDIFKSIYRSDYEESFFTLPNLTRLAYELALMVDSSFDKSIDDLFGSLTHYYGVDGKDSNKNLLSIGYFNEKGKYLIKPKLIISARYNYSCTMIEDNCYGYSIIKRLEQIMCRIFDVSIESKTLFINGVDLEFKKWIDTEFFQMNFFVGGSVHLKFKNKEQYYKLCKAFADIKELELPANF